MGQLTVKDFSLEHPIVQGGMGVGVSLDELAGAVSREGGLGIISSAGIKSIVSSQEGRNVSTYEAVRIEIEKAKSLSGGKPIGINIMCALVNEYEETVRASIDEGVDAIISGAGLPFELPKIKTPKNTALIPIISSARALEIIVNRWENANYRPDAVVLEGPKAGGHLGFKMNEIENPEFALEKLLIPVLETAHKYGDFPVIVAGGIYDRSDIEKFLAMGAKGVQMGTRFLVTKESAATDSYKQAVISAKKDDIIVVSYPESPPASPCGLPFRILKDSPIYNISQNTKCDKGYLLRKGFCKAMHGVPDNDKFFCLCNTLLASCGYGAEKLKLYTVGTNADRVDKILFVAELMQELT